MPNYICEAYPRYSKWHHAEPNHLLPTQMGCFKKDKRHLYESLETRFARAKHPDINNAEAAAICELIHEMLAYDPDVRPTAQELLKHPWFVKAAAGTK